MSTPNTNFNLPIPTNRPRTAEAAPAAPVDRPPLVQLMQTLLDQQAGGLALNLTLLPESGIMRHESYTDEVALAARIRELLNTDEEVAVSLSFGFRLGISKPPLRYLVTPWGNLPLFDPLPAQLDIEDDGFLGKRYDELGIQREAPDEDEVDLNRDPDAEDEEEEEEEAVSTVDDEVDIFTQRDDVEEEEE